MDEIKKSDIENKEEKEDSKHNCYVDLTPNTYDDDKLGEYHNALEYALNNDNISNIAISGIYGAGKSTILKSYSNKLEDEKSDKILWISLATFENEEMKNIKALNSKDGKTEVITNLENDLRQKIEKKILEKILYRDNEKTPLSRFRKIKKLKKESKIFIIAILTLITGGLIQIFNNTVIDVFIYNGTIKGIWDGSILLSNIVNDLAYLTLGCSLMVIFYKNLDLIYNRISISKLGVPNLEIEIGSNNGDSLFSEYIDEIIYFFKENEYDVVIFEDIDRFENIEVFSHLRELNSILNENMIEKEHERIFKFVYAVSDSILTATERVKFFDFIIPVIPYSNYNNSREVASKEFKALKEKAIDVPSDKIIKHLTSFVYETRLIKNIINEYIIYSKTIKNNLDPDRLFAMIVYKNLMPTDFDSLHKNQGNLHDVFKLKSKIIEEKQNEYKTEITKLKLELEKTKSNKNVLDVVNDYENALTYRYAINGKRYDMFVKGEYKRVYVNRVNENLNIILSADYIKTKKGNIDPSNFLTLEGTKINYNVALNTARSNNTRNLEDIEKNIRNNQRKILELQKDDIYKHIDGDDKILEDCNNLIKVLFINGYIREDYYKFTSYFYPGYISKEDNEFYHRVITKSEVDFKYKVTNPNDLVLQFSTADIRSKSILNESIIDYLYNNEHLKEIDGTLQNTQIYIKSMADALSEDLDDRFYIFDILFNKELEEFDYIYSENGFEKEESDINEIANKFLLEVCNINRKIFDYILNEYNDISIEFYFLKIMSICSVEIITDLNSANDIERYIANEINIFEIHYIDDNISRNLIEIISKTDIKLLNFEHEEMIRHELLFRDLMDYVIENHNYIINYDAIEYIYKFDESTKLEKFNYSRIKNNLNKSVIIYINDNIEIYMSEVYLKNDEEANNDEDDLLYLINNNDIENINTKKKIIEDCKFNKFNLADINEIALHDFIIDNNKWNYTWANIYQYQLRGEIHSNMISKINNDELTDSIATIIELDKIDKFANYVYNLNKINTDVYRNICRECEVTIELNKGIDIDIKHMEIIIEEGKINTEYADFRYIYDYYIDIYFKYLNVNIDAFLNLIVNDKNAMINSNNLYAYISNNVLSIETKLMILLDNDIKSKYIVSTVDIEPLTINILDIIMLLKDENLKINYIQKIMNLSINEEFKYKIYEKYSELFFEDINKVVNSTNTLRLIAQAKTKKEKEVMIDTIDGIEPILELLKENNYIENYNKVESKYEIILQEVTNENL